MADIGFSYDNVTSNEVSGTQTYTPKTTYSEEIATPNEEATNFTQPNTSDYEDIAEYDFEPIEVTTKRDEIGKLDELKIVQEPEPLWSKIRNSGYSKKEALPLVKQEVIKLVDEKGLTFDEAINTVGLNKPVQWNRAKYEKAQEVKAKVSEVSTLYSSLNINLDDVASMISSGKMTEDMANNLKAVGETLVKNGIIDHYDINTATGWTKDGQPVSLTHEGFWDIVNTNKNTIGMSIAAGSMLVASAPVSVPAAGAAIVFGGLGAFVGKITDMWQSETKLNDKFDTELDISPLQYIGEASKEAIADMSGTALVNGLVKLSGVAPEATKRFFDFISNNDYAGAVRVMGSSLNKTRTEMKETAKIYANLKGITDTEQLTERDWDKLIVESLAVTDVQFKGHLAGATIDKKAQQALLKHIADRTKEVETLGKNFTIRRFVDMTKALKNRGGAMVNMMKTSLDKSFKGIPLNTKEIQNSISDIQDTIASPIFKDLFTTKASTALSKVQNSLKAMEEDGVTMGSLFVLRTNYGQLLKQVGLFEDNIIKRSTKLGKLGGDSKSLMNAYNQINKFIDNTIKSSPLLTKTEKSALLNLKRGTDKAYSDIMNSLETQFMKNILSASKKQTEAMVDDMIALARNGHKDYDTIMKTLPQKAQVRVEEAMVKRVKDKNIKNEAVDFEKLATELSEILPKIKDKDLRLAIPRVIKLGSIMKQDPLLKVIGEARGLANKLAGAGLSSDPVSSVKYAVWSRQFMKLQVMGVNILESLNFLKRYGVHVRDLPLVAGISDTAEDVLLTTTISNALKSNSGSFKGFLTDLEKSAVIKGSARASVSNALKLYEQLAREVKPDQLRRLRAVEEELARRSNIRSDAKGVDEADIVTPASDATQISKMEDAIVNRPELPAPLKKIEYKPRKIIDSDGNIKPFTNPESIQANIMRRNPQVTAKQQAKIDSKQGEILYAKQAQELAKVRELDYLTEDLIAEQHLPYGYTIKNVKGKATLLNASGDIVRQAEDNSIGSAISLIENPHLEEAYKILDDMSKDIGYYYDRRYNKFTIIDDRGNEVYTLALSPEQTKDNVIRHITRVKDDLIKTHSIRNTPNKTLSLEDRFKSVAPDETITKFSEYSYGIGEGKELLEAQFKPSDKTISVYTADLEANSGKGAKYYEYLWDVAKDVGYTAVPSGLSYLNQIRMPVNIFKYVGKNGDSPQITIPRTNILSPRIQGKLATVENTKVMFEDYKNWLNDRLYDRYGVRITENTTDKQIENLVRKHQQENRTDFIYAGLNAKEQNLPLGIKTAKLIRDFIKTNNLVVGGILLSIILSNENNASI